MERKHKIIIGLLLFFIGTSLLAITQFESLKSLLLGGNFAFIEHHVGKSAEEVIATMKIPERFRDDPTVLQGRQPAVPESTRPTSSAPTPRTPPPTVAPEQPSSDQAYDPARARAYFQKASEHEQAGEFREAMEAYRQGLQSDKTNPEAFYRYAIISYDFGMRQEAMDAMGHAIHIERNNVDYRMSYARMLAQNNLREDARVQLQEVLRLDPGNRTASTLLRTLER